MTLTTNQLLGRDEKGELLPVEIDVPEFGGTILATPVARGEILRMNSEVKLGGVLPLEVDLIYIENHLKKPVLTKEQIADLPIKHVAIIVKAILRASGLHINDDEEKGDAIAEAEAEIRKK